MSNFHNTAYYSKFYKQIDNVNSHTATLGRIQAYSINEISQSNENETRSKSSNRPTKYYANSTATFHPLIQLMHDVEVNPGPETQNTLSLY